jgi:peptidoglycan-associated lipoprotein
MMPNPNAMKRTKLTHFFLLAAAVMIFATGCPRKPSGVTPIPGTVKNPPGGPGTMGQGGKPVNQGGGVTGDPANPVTEHPLNPDLTTMVEDPSHPLQAQTIYFDFDKSAIKSSEQSKLDAVANYLKSNPTRAVRVAGNCDERGTEDYNRALGSRRALAGREYLVNIGVDPARIDIVSYGEDKPAVVGHDETAYSKNRRDEFLVLLPAK